MNPISLGMDPEAMVLSPDGKLKSAIGIVPGSKEEKCILKNGHAAYYDNVLAEFNLAPGRSKEEVVANLRDCLTQYSELVKPNRLILQASATYPKGECEHKDAKLFGCSIEMCAYEICVLSPPECKTTFRSAGGHVHIGYDGGVDCPQEDRTQEEWEEALFQIAWQRIWVVRMCDLFLGIPSLLLDKDPSSAARRKLYGGAGTHRGCPGYGVEYRALSNFWLSRPSLVELIYDLATLAVKVTIEDRIHEKIWEEEIEPDLMRATINTANAAQVGKFMKTIKKYASAEIMSAIDKESAKAYIQDLSQWGIR